MGNSDSQAAFGDGVRQLLSEDISESNDEFWNALFSAPMSVEDIFEIVGPDHVRTLRRKRPLNLQALLLRTVHTLNRVCAASDEGHLPGSLIASANTAIRLQTRIAPFLLEEPDDPIVNSILWSPGGYSAAEALEDSVPAPHPIPNGTSSAADAPVAIGLQLLNCIGRLLFLPGYSVQPRTKMTGSLRGPVPTHRVDDRVVWKGGVGVSEQISAMPAAPYCRARCEVLRCLLSCLSGPLFLSSDEYKDRPPKWLLHFTGGDVNHTANLFCSLMSTAFSYDPIGWGLPYGGYFASGTEEDLVDVALQVLCVVMDFDPEEPAPEEAPAQLQEFVVENEELRGHSHGLGFRASKRLDDLVPSKTAVWGAVVLGQLENDGWVKAEGCFLPIAVNGKTVLVPKAKPSEEGEEKAAVEEKKKPRNVYRYMLQNITKEWEIDLIFHGLVRLLSTVHQANQTYLPNSIRSVGFFQEALVLLWHLLTLNKAFTRRVCEHLDTNQIMLPVLYLLQQAQGAPSLVGLLHTASFVLLVLSSERSFAVRLNDSYSARIPLVMPAFQGNHADVLTLSLYKVVSDSLLRPQSDALVEMCLTVLCNVSPYIKSYALESCLKILALVERCSRPRYLFRSSFTHHGLIFLLEMLNNLVQYQFEGNSMLVYSILRQKEVFQRLESLSLPSLAPGAAVAPDDLEEAKAVPSQDTTAEAAASETPSEAKEEAEDPDEDSASPWAPTEGWLSAVKKKMPLQALQCLVEYLGPKVEALCKENDVTDQEVVFRYLKQTTMVGILPVPHPIVIRTYQASSYTAMWFTSYMWGVIFSRSQRLPLYDWKKIRLVVINH